MRYLFFFLTAICITTVACKKNKTKPTPPEPPVEEPGFVQLRLRLTGELLTSEGPLPNGRRYADSTIYNVIVYRTATPFSVYAGGMFDKAGAISLDLPVAEQFNISVRAFKKGTGGGLFYTWQNGLPYFDHHFGAPLNNKMDTAYRSMVDTLSWLDVTAPADTTQYIGRKDVPELDVFRGTATVTVMPEPVSVAINMRRLSFGVQLSSPNFTAGRLILELHAAETKSVTPADIDSEYFIFASDIFKLNGEFSWPVKVIWEKPDGTLVPQGEKTITFKRNVLTTIQVTISDSGRTSLNPIITETDWSNTETVDF